MSVKSKKSIEAAAVSSAALTATAYLMPLLTAMPGIVFAVDLGGQLLTASEDGQRFLGAASLNKGVPLADFILPHSQDALAKALERLAADAGQRETISLWARRNDNLPRRLEGRMARVEVAQGGAAVLMTLADITPVYSMVEQYFELLEGLSQGVVVHRGGRPLFCNSALADLIAMEDRAAVMAEPSIVPFLHPEDLPMVMSNIQARLKGEPAPRDYQFRLVGTDGKVTWVDCRSSIINWEGEPAILACCFDINDHKWAEAAQRRSEELFSRVFHTSPDFMIISRMEDGVHLDVNESYQKLFGYSREEIIGRRSTDIGVWLDPAGRNRLLSMLRENRGAIRDVEFQFRAKNGDIRDVRISADIISFGNQSLMLVVGRDIAERKRQEDELIASKEAAVIANRTKSEFLANMSHELRTPLNAVLGFSELICNQIHGPISDPKYVEYANDIHSSGAHLLEIINDILDLSKVEAGRLEIHEVALSLDEILGNCLRLIGPRARESELILVSDVTPGLPDIIADERLMKQIVLNLLSNAVKFTPKGGMVRVAAGRTEDGGIELVVADTGIGMDQEGIIKAKTPFGQVDSSLSRQHEGTGLGLPLVIAFAERQGGWVEIESAIGKGTIVTVRFPAGKVVPS